MPNQIDDVALHALAAVTGAGMGAPIDIGADGCVRRAALLVLDVPLLSGADAELAITIDTASDAAGTFVERETKTVKSAGSTVEFAVGNLKRFIRAKWTFTGTAPVAATFSILGEAHQVYCEPRDVTTFAVPKKSLGGIEENEIWEHCIAGSCSAEGFYSGGFEMPLVRWDLAARQHVSKLVAASLFRKRGSDPQGPDAGVFMAESAVMKDYFKLIGAGKHKPPGIIDSTPEVFEGGSYVASRPSRGW